MKEAQALDEVFRRQSESRAIAAISMQALLTARSVTCQWSQILEACSLDERELRMIKKEEARTGLLLSRAVVLTAAAAAAVLTAAAHMLSLPCARNESAMRSGQSSSASSIHVSC